ncbi:MAG: acylphosphatase [Ardenticatenaceae bacterium]|nr:acylphosphatase [Anaerolineales bacterium]MCB8982356.1 acylphosphatase [Ardenticatenaceae bacterium]MCB8986316.1 acylphosphatase [Ardenticatenaceae bacterium]
MNKRLEAVVHGRVQGVNFRYYTQQEARRLQIAGWVANQADGTVRVVAEGTESQLTELRQFLHRGSPAAYVDRVDEAWSEATGDLKGFRVRWI